MHAPTCRIVLTLLALAVSGGMRTELCAQSLIPFNDSVEQRFRDAVALYERGESRESAAAFEALAREATHHRSTAACVMAARARLDCYQPGKTIALAEDFLRAFPASGYRGEARLLAGEAAEKAGKTAVALAYYVQAYDSSRSPAEQSSAFFLLFRLFENDLKRGVVEESIRMPVERETRDLLILLWVRSELIHGRAAAAAELFARLSGEALPRDLLDIREELARDLGRPEGAPRITILLPRNAGSIAAKNELRDVKDGILTALDALRATHAFALSPDIRTVPQDSMSAVVSALDADPSVLGIVGGVFEEDARALDGALRGTDLPAVTPAAFDDGDGGATLLRVAASARQQGIVLADAVAAAYPSAACAVLAALGGAVRAIADGFQERARERGLRVAVVSWYQPGAADLHAQLASVSAALARVPGAWVLVAPVASTDDAAAILSAAQAAGVVLPVVGNSPWNAPERWRLAGWRAPVDALLHDGVDSASVAFIVFTNRFLARTSRQPGIAAARGYQAAYLLLSAMLVPPVTRRTVLARMEAPADGLFGPLSFNRGRNNLGCRIVRIADGRVSSVRDFPEREDAR